MERPQEMKVFVSPETISMISVSGCVTLELLARQCAEIFLESTQVQSTLNNKHAVVPHYTDV